MVRHCKSCRQEKEEIEFNADGRDFKTCTLCRIKRKSNNKRLTIEECKEYALKKGGECLSETYKNNLTKMLWRCSENHEWEAPFANMKNKNTWCPHCTGRAKLTIEECKKFALNKNGLCLSNEYKNANSKMKWRCSEKHEWEATFGNIKNNKWCPHCSVSEKLTIEECQAHALNKNGECLSNEYINSQTKMKWRCSENHEWEAIFGNMKHLNRWCPCCAGCAKLTIEECKKFALNKNGECLSDEYINNQTKMKWRCSENHEWKAPFGDIKHAGNWCPHCAGCAKLTIEECKEFALNKNGECLSKTYKNKETHMLWKCSENHEWKATFGKIKNAGRWCPQCSSGRSEQLCRGIFEEHYNAKFPNKKPKFLKGLELDGYNEELNIAFEYNGRQHYKYIPYFHKNGEQDFIEQQERDRRKYRICAKKNIKLILIPYKFDCYNPDKLKIFILDAISTI
jgi:hypothetical protein